VNWIDTHTHLYHKDFDRDRADMLVRCREQGVWPLLMPNVDHASIDGMMEVESRNPGCVAMMGLHPCSVTKEFERELYIVETWLSKRKFAAVGEIGTDLYWDKTFWDQQKEAFTIQVNWAKQYGIPVVIHSRESIDETIALVESLQDGHLTGVFHCFTGTVAQAQKIAALDFYLGIGGVATFKKGGLDVVIPEIPLDRIVLETDSPYLAPVPHRGKRNESSYIPLIADKVAELKKVTVEALAEATTANAIKLFSLSPQLKF
jgi:TatD DNase family protein